MHAQFDRERHTIATDSQMMNWNAGNHNRIMNSAIIEFLTNHIEIDVHKPDKDNEKTIFVAA